MRLFGLTLLVVLLATSVQAEEFKGYQCTVDCSGHEAGYKWAEENGIDDVEDCTGDSNSFIEGCKAYVEENGGKTDEDDSDDNQ